MRVSDSVECDSVISWKIAASSTRTTFRYKCTCSRVFNIANDGLFTGYTVLVHGNLVLLVIIMNRVIEYALLNRRQSSIYLLPRIWYDKTRPKIRPIFSFGSIRLFNTSFVFIEQTEDH